MPQVDYSKIVIYKIQHETKDELLYVGSTTHFGNRKRQHKGSCYNVNEKSHNLKLYSTIRDNGGWDAFNMVIVKEFPCENKRQAEAEEDKIMREMKAGLNMKRAFITKEEKQEYYKEYNKDFYQQNRERILEQMKEYNKDNIERIKEYNKVNKDKINERKREYHEKNKEKIKERKKEYRDKNKEKIKEQTQCDCGCIITKINLSRHKRSIKHQEYLNQQTDQ